MKKHIIWF